MMWTTFGLVWDLRMLGFIDTGVEEVVYLCCDFSAKVSLLLDLLQQSVCYYQWTVCQLNSTGGGVGCILQRAGQNVD